MPFAGVYALLGENTVHRWYQIITSGSFHGSRSPDSKLSLEMKARTKDLNDEPCVSLRRLFDDGDRPFGTSLQSDKSEFSAAVQ